MANQASEDGIRETIERLLRFNCPNGCDGNGTYPEMSPDGEWDQGQCQWCFEYGMPARDAIQSLIRTEKLKLLDKLDKSMPTAEQLAIKYGYHMPEKQYGYKLALHDIREVLTKLEANQ